MNRAEDARAREAWFRSNAGEVYAAYDIPDRPGFDECEARADAVDAEYRHRFGRKLTDEERAAVHLGASFRRGPGAVITGDSYEIAKRLGYTVISTEHNRQASKIVMRDERTGEWTGGYGGVAGEHLPPDPRDAFPRA